MVCSWSGKSTIATISNGHRSRHCRNAARRHPLASRSHMNRDRSAVTTVKK
jgi:hypothetical protein